MPKQPYTGLLKSNRVSIFKLDPTLARWILRRPAISTTKNLFGHAVNEEHGGILFRDEDEARAAQRRMDLDPWDIDKFGNLEPFTLSEQELNAKDAKGQPKIPLIEWPYLAMVRKAQAYQTSPAEVPVGATRRELFHFIRDKSAAVAGVARDFTSLQMQVVELQKAMAAMLEAQRTPGQAVPGLAPEPSFPPTPSPVVEPSASQAIL